VVPCQCAFNSKMSAVEGDEDDLVPVEHLD
jgi:hypothetical protein